MEVIMVNTKIRLGMFQLTALTPLQFLPVDYGEQKPHRSYLFFQGRCVLRVVLALGG